MPVATVTAIVAALVLALLFLLPVLAGPGDLPPASPSPPLQASLELDGETMVVRHAGEVAWTQFVVVLNPEEDGGGGFRYRVASVEPGSELRFPLRQVTDAQGASFNLQREGLRRAHLMAREGDAIRRYVATF